MGDLAFSAADWIDAVLKETRDLTASVREFKFDIGRVLKFSPGAHLDLLAAPADVPFDQANVRSYSLVAADAHGLVTIAVKAVQNSRGGSRYMWSLRPGDRLSVTLPGNAFALSQRDVPRVLLAAGIGVTPLVSMAGALVAKGAPVSMLYIARTPQELAYESDLRGMLGEGLRAIATDDNTAFDLKQEIAAFPADCEVYMCGPVGLMDAVRQEWTRQGRPASALRFETFGSAGGASNLPFTVRIPRLGTDIEVAANVSMLDALAQAGVPVISGCRKGECGLCAMDVVATDSELQHRDVFFSESQKQLGKRLCTCVSRCSGGVITIEPAWRGDPDLTKPEVLVPA